MNIHEIKRTRAQESREAIQRLYIAMRHLFIRGNYKPLGESGRALIDAMRVLQPEIYGSLNDAERVELDGLHYIFLRLPKGIEECRFIKLISKEGFDDAHFQPIIAPNRRRNAYRIDEEQMFIEMTRGRSDIYDILTHLTFMFMEAEKIRMNSLDVRGNPRREWLMLEEIVNKETVGEEFKLEVAYTYLSTILGRTYREVVEVSERFAAVSKHVNSLFHITYWLGKISIEEAQTEKDREISFSSALREKIGHHVHGEVWANHIKQFLKDQSWMLRPIHIISANLHSVMNTLYGFAVQPEETTLEELARKLSLERAKEVRQKVEHFAQANGMYILQDSSGANIGVQIFDTTRIDKNWLPKELTWNEEAVKSQQPLLFVMDYAFGEQAYETMDELLKPLEVEEKELTLNVQSISIMGKAGILEGRKGDIMVATAHIFEGTADNYPIENQFTKQDFEGYGLAVYEGPMVTVLGTSLQNKDILYYFLNSSWRAVGLEMEGAHYQKAIQAASKIRKSIHSNVTLRYAYYASDNPLVTGATLASGSLGVEGVKPTYLVTLKILEKIFKPTPVGIGQKDS